MFKSRKLFVVEKMFFKLCTDGAFHSAAQNLAHTKDMLIGEETTGSPLVLDANI